MIDNRIQIPDLIDANQKIIDGMEREKEKQIKIKSDADTRIRELSSELQARWQLQTALRDVNDSVGPSKIACIVL